MFPRGDCLCSSIKQKSSTLSQINEIHLQCCPQSRPGFGISRVNLGRLKSLVSALFEENARRSDRPSVHRKQHLGTYDLNDVNEYH